MKWLLLIPAILVSSCSSPSNNKIENKQEEKTIVENLESKAKRQMMATIKELANNPSSVSISKFEKEFEFDSLYVAKFTMRAQNEFGGYSITDYEYIYMIKEDGIHDALVDLKVNPKIIMLAARAFNVASKKTLSKILCKWKQDSAVSLFLYLDSVFKNKHKLIHNQAPVMNRLCPFLLNLHK